METASIDEAKTVLYGLPVDSFVAERDVLVKAIRSGGDRTLANEVKALRKPSAVAALVNQVVRADLDGVELILQAAALLRAAQAGALEGTSINASELQQQYRAAIGALAQSAPDRRAEVRAALEAATIDEASNEDLRTGCLVVVPTPVSIFGNAPPAEPVPKDAEQAVKAVAEKPVDELEERRARRRADNAVDKATDTKTAMKASATKDAKAAERAAAEQAAAKAAEEAAAAAAAIERERKDAEEAEKAAKQERKKARKQLQKRHRDAVRAHLAALDDEEAASAAVEQAEQDVVEADEDIEAAEQALAELREQREQTVAQLESSEQEKTESHTRAEEAQAAVDALAETLTALESSES